MRNATPPAQQPQTRQRAERGGIVLYLIIGLVAFGVLAMAGSGYIGSSFRGVLAPNCTTASRMAAESGLRFAAARLRAATTQAQLDTIRLALNGKTYSPGGNLSFTLAVSAAGTGRVNVTATGRGCASGVPVTTAETAAVNIPTLEVIDFTNVVDDFFRTVDLLGVSPITVDGATNSISFGMLNQGKNAAAIWYAGNATGGCVNGNCTMNYGLRAAFDIQWVKNSVADGLVFGILSSETNTVAAVGGETWMGELMGWGGRGTSGLGIRAPKLGLEFDTYYNECKSGLISAGSRCDATQRDHMAYVFWGSHGNYSTGGVNYGPTFDDNRHGAGSGSNTEPIALANPDGQGGGRFGYYYGASDSWLTSGNKPQKYAIRYELTRVGTANARGDYPYVLKTWIRTGAGTGSYIDVSKNYTAAAPDMERVIHLSPAMHDQLRHIFFGWTEGTGDDAQKLTVSNFHLAFKNAPEVPTVPQDYVSYWAMNEGSGTTVADANATNHNTGTIQGVANWVSSGSTAYGKALSFSGDTARVQVPAATSLNLTSTGAISLWMYPTALTDNTYLLHKGDQSDGLDEDYSLRISTGGKLELRLRYAYNWWWGTSSYITLESAPITTLNKWYHVVAQWDSGILVFYIDGEYNALALNTNSRQAMTSGGALVIGAHHTDGVNNFSGFNGYIDEVYLYKRLLTASEIAGLSILP